MRFIKVCGFLFVASLVFSACSSSSPELNNQSNGKVQDAVIIGNLVWQDNADVTKNSRYIKDAIEYCKNLNLADVKSGWRLPTIQEAETLEKYMDRFTYKDSYYYHSSSSMCGYSKVDTSDPLKLVFSPLYIAAETLEKTEYVLNGNYGNGSCNYSIGKNGFSTYQSKKAKVRCVVERSKYDEAQRKKMAKIRELQSIDDFDANLELYRLTKDMKYIKRAYSKASNMSQKIKAEHLLAKNMKDKLFDIIGGKDGKSKLTTQKATVLGVVSGAALTDKDFVKNITVKSDFLEYGTYRVKIKFVLKLHYHAVMMGIGTSTSEKEVKYVTFVLSPKNHFRQTKAIRFKRVPASMNQSIFGHNALSIKLQNAELSYELESVE